MEVQNINRKAVKDILIIGVPSFLEALFITFANIIDSKMVSAIGLSAISAVSVTNPPKLFILSVFIALNTVMTSLVAKCVGEDDQEKANRYFDAVIKMVLVLSVILSIVSVALARPIMMIFSNQADIMDASVTYFSIVMAGMIFNTVFLTINAAFRGCGHTKITFTSNVISCCVNILFNWFLIEGHMGFPALGIRGAALATVIGMAAAMVFVIITACKPSYLVNIPYAIRKKYKVTKESTAKIRELAKSTIADGMITRVSLLLIGAVVARIGSFHMAVYAVGMHLMTANQALGTGFQTSGVALIGKYYGAGDNENMLLYKKAIVQLTAVSSVVLGLAIALGGRWYYSFFSDDPEFISIGAKSCLFIGVIALSQTMKFAYVGILQGVGAMKEVMKASIVSFSIVNLGVLAFCVFVLKWGVWGAWTGSLCSQTVQAFMLFRYIKKNPALNPDLSTDVKASEA